MAMNEANKQHKHIVSNLFTRLYINGVYPVCMSVNTNNTMAKVNEIYDEFCLIPTYCTAVNNAINTRRSKITYSQNQYCFVYDFTNFLYTLSPDCRITDDCLYILINIVAKKGNDYDTNHK
eukprot:265104_1